MRLLTLVFYFTVGYLLWRFVRSMMRGSTAQGSAPPPSPSKEGAAARNTVFRKEEIKDAEFEDITSPPDSSSKNTPH
jgi:hypothetical protein